MPNVQCKFAFTDKHGDDICCCADCPYCADFCPVTESPEACKYREDDKGGDKH